MGLTGIAGATKHVLAVMERQASGAIVNPFEILDAVNKGVIESGQWWTHYATGKHPAGGLFSAPLGGSPARRGPNETRAGSATRSRTPAPGRGAAAATRSAPVR